MQKYFGKFCTIHGLIRVLHVGTQAESRSDSACKIFLTNCIQITKKCSQKLKNIWNILKLILFRKNAYLSTWLHVHYQHVHCLHVNTCSLSTCTCIFGYIFFCNLNTICQKKFASRVANKTVYSGKFAKILLHVATRLLGSQE